MYLINSLKLETFERTLAYYNDAIDCDVCFNREDKVSSVI